MHISVCKFDIQRLLISWSFVDTVYRHINLIYVSYILIMLILRCKDIHNVLLSLDDTVTNANVSSLNVKYCGVRAMVFNAT